MPYITYDEGDGQVKSLRLKQDGTLTIGRNKGSDICLPDDPKVSRAHCSIYYYKDTGSYAISDLKSTNGTILNGMRISNDVLLSDGDEISIGAARLRFHAGEQFQSTQSREIKKAEPVMAFGLPDPTSASIALPATSLSATSTSTSVEAPPPGDHTQSLKLGGHDSQEMMLQFGVDKQLEFKEGDSIDGNRIVRRLSDTQMASVFLVKTQEGLELPEAAMKVFKKTVESDKAIEDFLLAVDSAMKLAHPSFVKYLDCGVHEGHAFYLAEYMDNLNLAKRISRKAPFPEKECLETAISIGKALGFANSHYKIFHRNLKPSNILFNKDGEPVIADYGLAVWESVNLAGSVSIASPWYISPEQVLGRRIAWTSDLYSLGVILFQMSTGVLPFHSMEENELLAMHLETPFPAPKDRNPNVRVSRKTVELMKKMTAKDPSDRFESWTAFLEAAETSLAFLYSGVEDEAGPFRPDTASAPPVPPPPERTGAVRRAKIPFSKRR